jgi:16S rRNA (guanine(966)-N(2))-methyltransferase RsmD
MRVIAGIAKGHKLKAPRGLRVRPPLDRIKESLFDILGGRVEDARVLDLYAGSGSLGIEALSRGSESATFVDSSLVAIQAIKENLAKTGLGATGEVIRDKVTLALKKLTRKGEGFDLIFLDPPFKISLIELNTVFESLGASDLVKEKGTVVLRLSTRRAPLEPPGFRVETNRVYGDSRLLIYRKSE